MKGKGEIMKIVIQTQYRENYAAHNEDYVHGVSEPYWKFKGGDTYVVSCSLADAQDSFFRQAAMDAVTFSNEAAEEYVLDYNILDDADFSIKDHIQDWETPTNLWFDGENFCATKITHNDEFGYMRSEIKGKTESWIITKENNRSKYECSFIVESGDELSSSELKTYLAEAA